jgi:hypothetical protein
MVSASGKAAHTQPRHRRNYISRVEMEFAVSGKLTGLLQIFQTRILSGYEK